MNTIRQILAALIFAVVSLGVQAADFVYDSVLDDAFTGNILKTDTFKCALINSTGVSAANIGSHTRFSDVTGEVTGTGYTAGGVTVVPTFTKDTTNHRLTITIPSHNWPSSTITARGEVCYKSTGTASTSPLILLNDFTSDVTTSNGTFTVNASTIHFNTPQ